MRAAYPSAHVSLACRAAPGGSSLACADVRGVLSDGCSCARVSHAPRCDSRRSYKINSNKELAARALEKRLRGCQQWCVCGAQCSRATAANCSRATHAGGRGRSRNGKGRGAAPRAAVLAEVCRVLSKALGPVAAARPPRRHPPGTRAAVRQLTISRGNRTFGVPRLSIPYQRSRGIRARVRVHPWHRGCQVCQVPPGMRSIRPQKSHREYSYGPGRTP